MKAFADAKTRLKGCLSDPARAALARAMFRHILAMTLQCDRIDQTYVVTNADDVAKLASAAGAAVLRDPQPSLTLGELMDWALNELASREVKRAVILMSDEPQVQASDIGELCHFLDTNDCVMVSDRRGLSTNALALRLPFHGKTAFGRHDSYLQHRALVRALGLRGHAVDNPRIAHDVDILEDLALLEPEARGALEVPAEVADRHQGW